MMLGGKLLSSKSRADVPFVVSHTLSSATGSTAVFANKPISVVEGNVLFAILATNQSFENTVTAPEGWTAVRTSLNRWFCYKIAGASEPSSYTFNFDFISSYPTCLLLNITNASLDTIGAVSTVGLNPLAPSINLSDKSLVIAIVTTTTTSNTASVGGFTLVAQRTSAAPGVAAFSKLFQAGPTGNVSTTTSSSASIASLVSFV